MTPYAHRQRQLSVRNTALARLLALWRIVDIDNLDTVETFSIAAVPVVDAGFGRSSVVSAGYYQSARPPGITTVTVPTLAPPIATQTVDLLRGAGLAGIVNGRRRGMEPSRAMRNGFVKVAGSAASLVLSGGRETLLAATRQDPAATGRWQRVSGATSCEFCSMLAGRGFAYSEETADFAAHDHCGCSIEPEFA